MRRLGILALVALLVSSCAPAGIDVAGQEALPSATAQDWVTYADYLVQIRVESEERFPPTEEEIEAGEGTIGREVTVIVEESLWSRPGVKTELPTSMRWSAGGWDIQDKDERPLRSNGVATLVVDHVYLVPITYGSLTGDDRSPVEWLPLSGTAMLPFDDGVIGKGETIRQNRFSAYRGNSGGRTPMRDSVWNQRGADAAQILKTTKPDPAAAPYMDLDPVARYQATINAGRPSQTPGPGER